METTSCSTYLNDKIYQTSLSYEISCSAWEAWRREEWLCAAQALGQASQATNQCSNTTRPHRIPITLSYYAIYLLPGPIMSRAAITLHKSPQRN